MATRIRTTPTPDTAVLRTVSRAWAMSCEPSGVQSETCTGNTPEVRVSTGTLRVVLCVVKVRSQTSLVEVGTGSGRSEVRRPGR